MKLHRTLVILLAFSLTCNGRVIVKRQIPGGDFLNQIMQMFNFSSDNGPGHLFTNLFMQFMNQTTSVFAPFMGLSGGDPLGLFNNVMQQFMAVFAQVTGLWSNTVSRQMDMWSSNVPASDALEFQVINKSMSEMHRIQKNVELLSTLASKRDDKSFRETREETYVMMNNLWRCFDVEGHPDTNMRIRIDSGKKFTPEDYQLNMVAIHNEVVALWRMLSDRIVYDMRHPGGPHVYGHCPGSATPTTTESSSFPQPPSSSPRSDGSGIEFEES